MNKEQSRDLARLFVEVYNTVGEHRGKCSEERAQGHYMIATFLGPNLLLANCVSSVHDLTTGNGIAPVATVAVRFSAFFASGPFCSQSTSVGNGASRGLRFAFISFTASRKSSCSDSYLHRHQRSLRISRDDHVIPLTIALKVHNSAHSITLLYIVGSIIKLLSMPKRLRCIALEFGEVTSGSS
jgi:hypothetical protein